ncbi:MAG: MFS transporter [Sulfolobales archaeon]|nr:MFS transporter [Sulfolobales archaeon]
MAEVRDMWRRMYALGAALNTANWGLYFSFSRRYLSVDLGGGTQSVLLITGLEWVFTLFAIASGKLVQVLGGRYVVFLGVTGFIPFIAALGIHNPMTLAVVLSFASFSWAISWPSILSAVFSGGISPGKAYSYFTLGSGLGYSFGSLAMGPIYSALRAEGVFTTMAVIYLLTYLIFFIQYPTKGPSRHGLRDVSESPNAILKLIPVLTAFSFIVFARELLYSIAPLKLTYEIREVFTPTSELVEYTLFGTVFGGITALLSVPARVLAGKLSDRYNPAKILFAISIAYLITYWLFVTTEGLIPIIVWQLPLYPFLDVSINTYIARYVPRHAVTLGFGTVLTFSAIGGLLLLPILANPEITTEFIGSLVTSAVIVSIALIAPKLRVKG